MKNLFFQLILSIVLLISCGQDTKNDLNTVTDKVNSINEINIKPQIVLSESLESRRKEFESYVLSAQERIQIFAKQHQAHRLHIRILDNNEDLMGPIWFYEGFAINAADQFKNSKIKKLTSGEIWTIIKNPERGSYEKYGYLFRYFSKEIPLKDFLNKADEKYFV